MQHSTPPPNQEDQRRFDLLKEIGCLPCSLWGYFSWAEVHHLLSGNVRRGHQYTVPLCPWHHQGKVDAGGSIRRMATLLGPSLALESKRFHEIFGSDGELLEKTNARITKLRRLKDGTSDHGNTAGDPARSDAG